MNLNFMEPDDCLDLYDTFGNFDLEIYDNPLIQNEPIGSFSDYLIQHYEQDFLLELDRGLKNRSVPVGKTSKVVPHPAEICLDCGHIEKFCFGKPSKNTVQADAIIKARIALTSDSRNSRKAVLSQMYRMTAVIHFTGDEVLFDLTNQISIYRPEELPGPLSEYLIPFLRKEDMDSAAEEILSAYYPEALASCPVSGPELARRLGLQIACEKLSPDNSIMGQIFFEDGCLLTGEASNKVITKNTIVIDREACTRHSDKNINLVILHECVHFIKHRFFFYVQHLYNQKIHSLCYTASGYTASGYTASGYTASGYTASGYTASGYTASGYTASGRSHFDKDSPIYWIEYQADQIAYRLQLPLASVKNTMKSLSRTAAGSELQALTAEKLERAARSELQALTAEKLEWAARSELQALTAEKLEWAARRIASYYGVSWSAAKCRMAEIGCKGTDGILNFVDGHYIPAYSYSRDALKKGQTFTIELAQIIGLYQRDEKFRELSLLDYVYAEGHFCRNDRKYFNTETYSLTPYARSHMEECCLVFTRRYGEITYRYLEGSLLKEDKKLGYYIEYSGSNTALKEATAEDPYTALLRIQKMLDETPKDFSGTLRYHMSRLGWTIEELADRCRISARTIGRLLKNPYPNTTLETVVLLCLGMKLDPIVSHDLMDKSYVPMPPTMECTFYKILIDHMYLAGIDVCSEQLVRHGFKPFPKAA